MPRLLILSPSVVSFTPSFRIAPDGLGHPAATLLATHGRIAILDVLGRVVTHDALRNVLIEESRWSRKRQQIQRYEASDYQTASFARLREIARLLGLRIRESVGLVQN